MPTFGRTYYCNMLGDMEKSKWGKTWWHSQKWKAIVRSSLRVLDEFQIANERPQSTREPFPNEIKWCPPQLGCYKVNVDGAMFSKRKQVGIGVVIHDSASEVIAAQSKKLAFPCWGQGCNVWGGFPEHLQCAPRSGWGVFICSKYCLWNAQPCTGL